MKPRIFDQLPVDVNEVILSKLPLKEVVKLRMLDRKSTLAVDQYLLKVINFDNLSKLTRQDIAYVLQNLYAPGSAYFRHLEQLALNDSDASTYAMYALVADVTTLDAARLQAVMEALAKDGCPERMLASLNIIHHFITHGTDYDKELSALIAKEDVAYINLRGAKLVANFTGLNLSFADFRETTFSCCVTSASLTGANLCDATMTDKTIFKETITKDMKVKGVKLHGFVLESEEDETGKMIYEVPELAALMTVTKTAQGKKR